MQTAINGFYVYAFHHDDGRLGWTPLNEFRHPVLDGSLGEEVEKEGITPEFQDRLVKTLKACGWEGDGQLEAMMVPPWLGTSTGWFPVFHVKQSNNGTSWIASERRLTLEELDSELPMSLYRGNP